MSVSTDPVSEYQRRLAARRRTVQRHERRESIVANARLAVFLIGLFLLWATLWANRLQDVWLVAPVAAYAAAAIYHDRTLKALHRARRAVAHYERCLARVNECWPSTGVSGGDFLRPNHPYAADLDLFGRGSLFELLCTAQTRAGEKTLADWLCNAASPDVIRARHLALADLRDRVDLREQLAQLGSEIREGVLPDVLTRWAEASPVFTGNGLRIGAICASVFTIAALLAWAAFGTSAVPSAAGVIAIVAIMRSAQSRVKRVIDSIEEPRRELAVLAAVLSRLEREPFGRGRLREVQQALTTGGARASTAIGRLNRMATMHEARQNQMFAPIATLLLWDVQFAFAFESWRRQYGAHVARWLDAVGELEALCALAAYAYEHPTDSIPEVVEDGPLFDGVELGHPLLPAKSCVRNDVRLDSRVRVLIVSGSNMSGKSTLLRTIGINAVLALAGAPVRAHSLRLSPMAIGATLRIQDSIQTGDSRFYAEIRRLHQLMEIAHGRLPLLFLLDEILHGTNSHDRKIGADAVIRSFLDAGAIGVVTTHDLALTESVQALPAAENVHFEDHIESGHLTFDYKMRPGVVRKSNALELMRSIGLKV